MEPRADKDKQELDKRNSRDSEGGHRRKKSWQKVKERREKTSVSGCLVSLRRAVSAELKKSETDTSTIESELEPAGGTQGEAMHLFAHT